MSQPHSQPAPVTPAEYSPAEREILLRLAHSAIDARLRQQELDLSPPTAHLAEERGAFTTLHLHGSLRGCIGYVLPVNSLYRTVAETAIAAAFDDPRFQPVTRPEAADLHVEISIMSPLFPINPGQVEIGKHGLLVSLDRRRGLLLPQVPVEHGWDVPTFLGETCRKAGLPPDAWKQGAQFQAFTAEIFGE